MTERPKWERVADDTERLPVPGGWLYQVHVSSTSNSSIALCFVPEAKARHMRELSRQRAAAALTELEAAAQGPQPRQAKVAITPAEWLPAGMMCVDTCPGRMNPTVHVLG